MPRIRTRKVCQKCKWFDASKMISCQHFETGEKERLGLTGSYNTKKNGKDHCSFFKRIIPKHIRVWRKKLHYV